jgi:uncharacterized protein (DUF2147 family)
LIFRSALVALALLASPALAASPVGLWATEGAKGQVRIETCGEKLCGKIVALAEPNYPDGKPKIDRNNPDAALRERPIVGLPILRDFGPEKGEANKWSGGTIYDPESGSTYKCTMTLQADGTLEVRGYVGMPLLGRSQTWTAVK